MLFYLKMGFLPDKITGAANEDLILFQSLPSLEKEKEKYSTNTKQQNPTHAELLLILFFCSAHYNFDADRLEQRKASADFTGEVHPSKGMNHVHYLEQLLVRSCTWYFVYIPELNAVLMSMAVRVDIFKS